MRVCEPILDRRDICGVPDPTPFAAVLRIRELRERRNMTLEELIRTICAITRESESQVRYRIQNWRSDGLLPAPLIVSANRNGSGGTRGDWGPEHIIGYQLIERLRPKGHPVTIVLSHLDQPLELIRTVSEISHIVLEKHPEFQNLTHRETISHRGFREAFNAEWAQRVTLKPSKPLRLRLNTSALKNLIPLARGERFEELCHLWEAPWVGSQDVWKTLEGILRIWQVVAEIETKIPLRATRAEWEKNDALVWSGTLSDQEIVWRLSESKWSALHH